MPELLSPSDWNALVDYDEWHDPFRPKEGIVLHHGGGHNYPAGVEPYSRAKEVQQLQQWESYHLYGKGWRGLAYGYGIGQTGTVYRIRGNNRYGAHLGDIDGDGIANNVELMPVIFIGSGDHVRLSDAAHESLVWLRHQIGAHLPLYGHQEVQPSGTRCPGPYGMQYVRAHRDLEIDLSLLTEAEQTELKRLLPLLRRFRDYGAFDRHARLTAAGARSRADRAHERIDQMLRAGEPR